MGSVWVSVVGWYLCCPTFWKHFCGYNPEWITFLDENDGASKCVMVFVSV